MSSPANDPVPPPGCPAHSGVTRTPLYTPAFAHDPYGHYDQMRSLGVAAPVELAPGVDATLVTSYTAALHVLQNPDIFARDSRRWNDLKEGRIPEDSPVLPMMAYRPGPLFTDGPHHLRLRQAMTESLAKISSRLVTQQGERISRYLISQFNTRGKVDLVREYAQVLPTLIFNELFGCPADLGDRVTYGISGIFDGTEAEKAILVLVEALGELVALKRREPGDDVVSWLMQHPAALSDEEMIPMLIQLIGGGTEPLQNLIAGSLLVLLGDETGMLVEDAVSEVLWNSAPIANYATHFPIVDYDLYGYTVRAGDPVLISFAAANTDPNLSNSRQMVSQRAHLAWGAGPHACPAKDPALLISVQAVETLLNELPDVVLAVPSEQLAYRPGPFHRALSSLPARFTPVAPKKGTERQFEARPVGGPRTEDVSSAPRKGKFWSGFLAWMTK